MPNSTHTPQQPSLRLAIQAGIMKSFVLSLLLIQATFPFAAPSRKLEDRYLSDKVCQEIDRLEVKVANNEVNCGDYVSYKAVNTEAGAKSPSFQYEKADKDKLYMIFIVDADEPGCRTKLHYWIANLKGEKLANEDMSDEDVFSVYYPPVLEHGSPEHRFFVYAFAQHNPEADVAIPSARCHFDLNRFIDDDSLTLVAANMFKLKISE